MDFTKYKISLYEPFAEFLQGNSNEYKFEISLLDVVHLAGHACPSMVGAFLMARRAIEELYPESATGVRGEMTVDIAAPPTKGATGPISNVFSYITGAWAETGFGGLGGRFQRRGLLRFNSPAAPAGGYRFTRTDTGDTVDLFYDPQKIPLDLDLGEPFQLQWRKRIKAVLENPEAAITCLRHEGGKSMSQELDVTLIPPRLKHQAIFETFDGLSKGGSFVLKNDHDPVPLRYQFDAMRPAQFDWKYLEQGPDIWRVRLSKV